jgi:hypothetical protein
MSETSDVYDDKKPGVKLSRSVSSDSGSSPSYGTFESTMAPIFRKIVGGEENQKPILLRIRMDPELGKVDGIIESNIHFMPKDMVEDAILALMKSPRLGVTITQYSDQIGLFKEKPVLHSKVFKVLKRYKLLRDVLKDGVRKVIRI